MREIPRLLVALWANSVRGEWARTRVDWISARLVYSILRSNGRGRLRAAYHVAIKDYQLVEDNGVLLGISRRGEG